MRILLLLQFANMDMSRIILLGHSAGTKPYYFPRFAKHLPDWHSFYMAGGTLALWASSSQLSTAVDRESCFQSIKLLRPALCVPIAPIGNLVAGQLRRYI